MCQPLAPGRHLKGFRIYQKCVVKFTAQFCTYFLYTRTEGFKIIFFFRKYNTVRTTYTVQKPSPAGGKPSPLTEKHGYFSYSVK